MSVLITGASSGFGEACARAFARAGFDLVLTARREDRLVQLAKDLSSEYPIEAQALRLDVRVKSEVESLARKHSGLFSKINILVNNAGLALGLNPIQSGTAEDWDTMIDTNVKGLLYVTRAILPGMIERGNGHVVNVSSTAGHWTYPNGNVYCATKFAVHALSESLRLDLNGTGIRVTEIAPGMAETEFSEVRLGDKTRAKAVYAGMKPLSAEDVAETVLWCVQRPKHVNIQELILLPTDQASVTLVNRR